MVRSLSLSLDQAEQNVTANLVVTSNQLGCNNDCYYEVCHSSCYDEAVRIGILLRILRLAEDWHFKWEDVLEDNGVGRMKGQKDMWILGGFLHRKTFWDKSL